MPSPQFKEARDMTMEMFERITHRPHGSKVSKDQQREPKRKAEEALIDEILEAAGLDPLD